jgi:ssDNA-binding Zn-finger/Zn-ribbon topoisomerase 1
MDLRKIFNIPNEDQKELIEQDYEKMKNVAKDLASEISRIEIEYQEDHDGKCPNCGKSNIVNKITRTQGSGSVSGSFALGFGNIYGSSLTDTNGVNHCNECGNQWKKYESDLKWYNDFFKQWIRDIIDNYGDNQYSWVEKTMKLLKENDPYAETMYKIYKEVNYDLYRSDDLTLRNLRKLYKSVYDK